MIKFEAESHMSCLWFETCIEGIEGYCKRPLGGYSEKGKGGISSS